MCGSLFAEDPDTGNEPVNRANLMTLAAVMFAGSLYAQSAAGADLCTGAVDPYDIVSEKGRFYTAAGKDNELTEREFNANRSAANAFRRPFDRWSELLKFDRDANRSLDWMEADAYRYATRRRVLATYDANGDGRLAGDERKAACRALASGRIRFPVKRSVRMPPPARPQPKSHDKATRRSDKHHDGKSSHADEAARRKAHIEATKKKHQEYQAKRELKKFDRNKDGRLDGRETAERNKYQAEMKRRQEEGEKRKEEAKRRHDEFMRKYDTNRDGKLTGKEREAAKEAYRREARKRAEASKEAARKKMEEYRARKERSRFDRNKDGRLDAAETAARDKYLNEQKRRIAEYLKKYDANRDGKVTAEEKARYREEQEEHNKKKDKRRKKSEKRKPDKPSKKESRKKGR